MPNFWNLAFFGGGWHKCFWFGIFVKCGIFFNSRFFDIYKMLNLNMNGHFGHFCKVFAVSFGNNLATLLLLVFLLQKLLFQRMFKSCCRCQRKTQKQVKTFHVKCHFASTTQLVKQIFSVVKTWKIPKMQANSLLVCTKAILENEIGDRLYYCRHIPHNIATCHGCIFYCEILYLFAMYNLA